MYSSLLLRLSMPSTLTTLCVLQPTLPIPMTPLSPRLPAFRHHPFPFSTIAFSTTLPTHPAAQRTLSDPVPAAVQIPLDEGLISVSYFLGSSSPCQSLLTTTLIRSDRLQARRRSVFDGGRVRVYFGHSICDGGRVRGGREYHLRVLAKFLRIR